MVSSHEIFARRESADFALAVIDLVVANYIFLKFPEANSGQISWARSRVVSNSSLAAIAIKKLSLNKYLLVNNVELSKEIGMHIKLLNEITYEEFIAAPWKYEPPKAISDALEAIVGGVLLDSGYDFVLTTNVVERLLGDVLSLIHPNIPLDPVSDLLFWTAKSGCSKVRFL